MQENLFNTEDTISAISTPPGEGGIGIVRLSGPDAFDIVQQIFKPAGNTTEEYPENKKMYYGFVVNEKKDVIDEVLVSFMKSPKTYTREDIVEINAHGGRVVLNTILQIIREKGARLAAPGEFTKRAFINGRIDLSQAESVINVVKARSEEAVKLSIKNVHGELSRKMQQLKDDLFKLRAELEVTFDFPEDDIPENEYGQMVSLLEELYYRINKMRDGARKGVIFQEGLQITIAGKTNVGKSSLLNYLVQRKRAIVTEVPGTTRDTLEESINIKGVPVRLVDTAGLRRTGDLVESLGVERARQALEESDVIMLLLDNTTGIQKEDLEIIREIKQLTPWETVVIVNKTDIGDSISENEINQIMPDCNIFFVSVLQETGLEKLEDYLNQWVHQNAFLQQEDALIVSKRQEEALEAAERNIHNALQLCRNREPMDLVSLELSEVEQKIGEITGDNISGDLLERIFNEFCIGK